jgi:hypothetical protein
VHVFGAVYQGETLVRDFVLPHSVPAGDSSPTLTKAEVVAPGSYELYIGVRDAASGSYGLVQVPVQTPDFMQPSLSSIILSQAGPEQTTPPENPLDTVFTALQLGPYRFVPYLGNTVKSGVSPFLFYFVMKTGADAATGNAKLSIHYELQQNGQPKAKFNIPELPSSVVAHELGLAKHNLAPGNYELKIEIKDMIGGTTLNKTVPLTVQ